MNGNYDSIDFAKVPVVALRQRARTILSRSLNPSKVLPSEEGFPRDWRGIAHLAGLQSLYGPVISASSDQMEKVLTLWCTEGDNQTANFDNLVKFLGVIDRWDVSDDLAEVLIEDAQAYKSKRYKTEMTAISRRQENGELQEVNAMTMAIPDPDANVLTRDDVERAQQGLPPQRYDAFVLFADEDIDFAAELIDRMEQDHPRFGFKLCVKDRDLIGGVSFEHEAILRLISDRCSRLIVIVSKAFLRSSANAFFVNYAQALQIEQRRRRIIPCLYENCTLPPSLSFYFHLKYRQSGRLFNFWEKLSDSIRSTQCIPNNNLERLQSSVQITEVLDAPPQRAAIEAPPIVTEPVPSAPVKLPRTKGSKISATEPKMRPAYSMIQINVQAPNDDNVSEHVLPLRNCEMNHSETNLSETSSTKSSRNKPTWYSRFPWSGNSAKELDSVKSRESIAKPKRKKINILKKMVTRSTT